MQLALAPQTSLPADIAASTRVQDVVQPARLFALARVRLGSAIDALYRDDDRIAPTALAAGFAIQQAETAIGALRGINVPTSSFDHRRRASSAIDHALVGVQLLRIYQRDVRPMGDDPFLLDSLPVETRGVLDRGLTMLDQAMLRIN